MEMHFQMIVAFGLLGEAIFATGIVLLTLLAFHTTGKRSTIVGVICVIFGIILYASPLSVMKKVIKTKSVEYMPFWVCVAGFSNGIVWAVYAFLPLDPFVLTGNGVGCCLGIVQLCMHAKYHKSAAKGDSEDKPGKPSEVQLQVETNRTSA
ncbi:hypothetical protein ACH5RR_014413 [Cinchona calisaya]|uniref:Uncharacterized protein n=1 Tax=Cinchona calisaya TaxID=153742 RepID=A0ABD3A2R8_9GENT